jgi:hypothetical protein
MFSNRGKIDYREIGLTALIGVGVFVLTPIFADLVKDIAFMNVEVIPKALSVAQILGATGSILLLNWGVDKWLRE